MYDSTLLIVTSPFKSMHFQIFFLQTIIAAKVDKSHNHGKITKWKKKLIKAINILIVVFWCLFYSNTSHFNTKTKLDVVVCVNGNHNVLKFTFTLKALKV